MLLKIPVVFVGDKRNGFCNGDTNHTRRENTVKDLTQKLASTLASPPALDADGNPIQGVISRAKEGKISTDPSYM